MTLNRRQMITFGVLRWNDVKGGMRFAFPPYGPATRPDGNGAVAATDYLKRLTQSFMFNTFK